MQKYGNIEIHFSPKQTLFNISGISLTNIEANNIRHAYEIACTAEYLMENYTFHSEQEAWQMAMEVRELMSEYDISEAEAISQFLGGGK